MKKVYLQPTMTVVRVQQRTALLADSTNLYSVSSNADIILGETGSSENARTKEYSVWDDDWSN